MKIKTNIYHFTADNGERYPEDFADYSVTVYASGPDEAVKKGVEAVVKKQGWDDGSRLCNCDVELVLSDVLADIPTPKPIECMINENDFNFDFDKGILSIANEAGDVTEINQDDIVRVQTLLTNILQKISEVS